MVCIIINVVIPGVAIILIGADTLGFARRSTIG